MIRTWSKRIMYLVVGLVFLLVLIPLLLDVLFPMPVGSATPQIRAGMRFSSEWEGLAHSVDMVVGGHVKCTVTLAPYAAGPPAHSHQSFDEHFQVLQGFLSLDLDGRTQVIGPGGFITIPRGCVHRIHNTTDEPVVITGDPEKGMYPAAFGGALAELYAFVDEHPDHQHPPAILLKIAAMGDAFDSWISGPPIGVQRFMRRVLRPYARLFGQARLRYDRQEV